MISNLINDDNCINLYMFGSYVYKTNNSDSDQDYIAIVKELYDFGTLYNKDNITIHFITENNFITYLSENEIQALECYFIPKEFILKETKKFTLNINKEKLRVSISTIVSNSYVRGKKKLTIQGDYDKKLAIKSIFHSLRISDFGKQIALENKIVDYSSMNWLLLDLWKITENKESWEAWNIIDNKYRSLYNKKCSEFKALCPKENTSKIKIHDNFIIINGNKINYNDTKETIIEILNNLNINYNIC